MDVLTFETCSAVNSEIIKQVTSSCSIFIQLSNSFFLTGISTYVTMISGEKVFRWRLDSSVVRVKASGSVVFSCAEILLNALDI